MTKLILLQYKMEFETTPITLNELIEKYQIKLEDLKGHETWQKTQTTIVPGTDDIIVAPQTPALIVPSEDIKADIKEFKNLAMSHCLTFMKNDARFAEVKEFKDIVSIVNEIEKSEDKSPDSSTTVNVLIQNITQGFRDDC